jgi:hypothetical protein
MNAETLVNIPSVLLKNLPGKEKSDRADYVTANHVNMGIGIQQSYGTSCAIEYLKAKGVSNHVTERVLAHPDRRRLFK